MYQNEEYGQVYTTYDTGHPVPETAQEKGSGKKQNAFHKFLLSISLGLLFGIFAGIGFCAVQQGTELMQKEEPAVIKETPKNSESEKAQTVEKQKQETVTAVQPVGTQKVFANTTSNVAAIVEEVMPAMVSVNNTYVEKTVFWGQTYEEEYTGSGSGIIVAQNETELLIVSNHHVVADTKKLVVTLIDGTQVEAKIKGTDEDADLAVIAISLSDLSEETKDAITIASLGNSDALVLGEQVIAIGNALGYGQSVTVGYVSALDREIELESGSHRKFIQTDAAINKGNSGGALLNLAGEVIGINSNKIGGGTVEGMGYAIPITTASPVIADLMERQTRSKVSDAEKGYIGISQQEITEQIAYMYGMPKGVYVLSVVEGSGAEAAGIVKGDIITKFDGNRITSINDLQVALQYCAAGDTVKVTVMRPENGEYQAKELTLTLGEQPANRRR